MTISLNKARLAEATQTLCERDSDLARVVEEFGVPPLWKRPQGFRTLLYLILEQQVSLASARATYEKLVAKLGGHPAPDSFLVLNNDDLRGLGFSRQKTRYCRLLAEAVVDGSLPINKFRHYDDEAAKAELMKITGIGHWTADVYLMEALGRPDVWPVGDLALAVGAEKIKNLNSRPNPDELQELGEQWRPYRAVAARILWHYYLSVIRPPPGGKPS
ncbi:MAG: DNA-3-methyladenine glycosylase family protein [Alphaproteobacteria bacterium]